MNRKIGDYLAVTFIVILGVLLWLLWESFLIATKTYPYWMGALKFGLLATFGSQLKIRRRIGQWVINPLKLVIQAVVWAIIGVWITAAFPAINGAVEALLKAGMWPNGPALWAAFTKSFWITWLAGYAYFMMLTHEYLDRLGESLIEMRGFLSLVRFGEILDKRVWFGTIPFSILWFWLPAHTITFSLPGELRILFAAILSVALGFLTTFKK